MLYLWLLLDGNRILFSCFADRRLCFPGGVFPVLRSMRLVQGLSGCAQQGFVETELFVMWLLSLGDLLV